VQFRAAKLKHNDQIAFEPFIVLFETRADIHPFDIDYTITAEEPIDPIKGTIRFEVELQSEDG